VYEVRVLIGILKAADFRRRIYYFIIWPLAAILLALCCAICLFPVAAFVTCPLEFKVCQASRRTRPS
jgi:hypothetical protein